MRDGRRYDLAACLCAARRRRVAPRMRNLSALSGAIALLLASNRCDQAIRTAGSPPCAADSTVFLESKYDDDDGDGNPNDEDFPRINDEDDDIADHTWCQDGDGLYHLFFQNEGLIIGNEIEHYVTTDLQS